MTDWLKSLVKKIISRSILGNSVLTFKAYHNAGDVTNEVADW